MRHGRALSLGRWVTSDKLQITIQLWRSSSHGMRLQLALRHARRATPCRGSSTGGGSGSARKFEMGKLPPALLARSVLSHLGAKSDSVVVGPALGEDSAVLRVDHANRLVSATTDPITGASASIGHLVVHVNANDVAASGADPKWLLLTQVRGDDDRVDRAADATHSQLYPVGTSVQFIESIAKQARRQRSVNVAR